MFVFLDVFFSSIKKYMSILFLISFYFLDPLFAQLSSPQTKPLETAFTINQTPCLSNQSRTILKKSLLVYENLEKFGKFILWFKKNPLFFESFHVFDQQAKDLYLHSFSSTSLQFDHDQKKHQKQCISLKIKKIKRQCENESENQKRQVLSSSLKICLNLNTQKFEHRFESCQSLGKEDLWIVSDDFKSFQAYRTDAIVQKTCDDLQIHQDISNWLVAYQDLMTYKIIEQNEEISKILFQKDTQVSQDQIFDQTDLFESDQSPRYPYHAQNRFLKDIYGEINSSQNHQQIHLAIKHLGPISQANVKGQFESKSDVYYLVKEDLSVHTVDQDHWLLFWQKLSQSLEEALLGQQNTDQQNTDQKVKELENQIKQLTKNLAYLMPQANEINELPKIELKISPFQYQQNLLELIKSNQ
jgi:hypothetical protein